MLQSNQISGLVTYFTVDFRSCHKTVTLSTSPYEPYTHWKQTVFYFENSITANDKEAIYGLFKMKQNKNCNRDLDIFIDICYSGRYSPIHWIDLEYKIR